MPIVILFLSANPAEGAWLKVDQEAKEIEYKLAQSKFRDGFELVKEPGVSVEDIQYLLLQKSPNIVHFSGHGEVDAIYLQGADGHAQKLSERALSDLFGIVNRNGTIKVVVLNACYSEDQARAIAQHVGCVIGMTRAISDDGARGFASSFYQGLAFGKSVQDSFLLGTNYLAMLGVPDEDVPKLHHSPSADPAKVFLGSGEETGREAEPSKEPLKEPSKEPLKEPSKELKIVGSWDATGRLNVGYLQSPMTLRVIFYANGTFEESGTMGGSPFYSRGNYSFDPVRSLLMTQEYNTPFPTSFFLSDATSEAFTATAPAGVLNFRRLS
ncbi:MAG: CHAT domain-containing protein [Nitrososphaerales archaeon]